jgi:hypothetical protein
MTTRRTIDVFVQYQGTIVLLTPQTHAAHEWFNAHVAAGARFGPHTVCHQRLAPVIIHALEHQGYVLP